MPEKEKKHDRRSPNYDRAAEIAELFQWTPGSKIQPSGSNVEGTTVIPDTTIGKATDTDGSIVVHDTPKPQE